MHGGVFNILKSQVNYILQTMEKMAELRIDTIEPRSRTRCIFSTCSAVMHSNQLNCHSHFNRQDRTIDFQGKMGEWTQGRNFSTQCRLLNQTQTFFIFIPVHLCRSWYKNSKGINFILWPVNLLQYWWMTRLPDLLNDFKLTFDKAYFDL